MKTITIAMPRDAAGNFDDHQVQVDEMRIAGDRIVFDIFSGQRISAVVGRMEDGNLFHLVDGAEIFTNCVVAEIGRRFAVRFLGRRPWP